MNVTEANFDEVLDLLKCEDTLAADTETSGLRSFHGDKLFSIAIATKTAEYYFNFNDFNEQDKHKKETILPRSLLPKFKSLFDDKFILWVMGNAKFDLHMLAKEGLYVEGNVYDVLVMARLERNDHFRYSLASCAERIGLSKSVEVDEWIKKNKAYKKEYIPGKKGARRNPQFAYVPLPIISKYACQDVRVTYDLYLHQVKEFQKWEETHRHLKSIFGVMKNEIELTKVCFDMERHGILLDREFVEKALSHEMQVMEDCKKEFLALSGSELVDSNKALAVVFKDKIEAEKTEKGNDSFTEKTLSRSNHPLADCLLRYRDANKRSSSYYSTFLYHADSNNVVHCNIRQSATTTGRFSISDPALQTLNKEEKNKEGLYDTEWRVRRSFKPRDGFVFVGIDYKAFEFRAMLDTASERELADAISNGYDPHKATADLVGISRSKAKTLNFLLLFGGGIAILMEKLGISEEAAVALKKQYFDKLPKIKRLMYDCSDAASHEGHVVNRFGRPYFFPDPKWAYKALNAIIQGGTADAIKHAMVKIHVLLSKHKSKMVLQIHDEILAEISEDELYLIPIIKKIMEDSWPERFHKMECSVEIGKSWGNMEEYEI